MLGLGPPIGLFDPITFRVSMLPETEEFIVRIGCLRVFTVLTRVITITALAGVLGSEASLAKSMLRANVRSLRRRHLLERTAVDEVMRSLRMK